MVEFKNIKITLLFKDMMTEMNLYIDFGYFQYFSSVFKNQNNGLYFKIQ